MGSACLPTDCRAGHLRKFPPPDRDYRVLWPIKRLVGFLFLFFCPERKTLKPLKVPVFACMTTRGTELMMLGEALTHRHKHHPPRRPGLPGKGI